METRNLTTKIVSTVIIAFVLFTIVISHTGCSTRVVENQIGKEWIPDGNFIIVECKGYMNMSQTILEDKYTGCLYIYLENGYHSGLSPILNPDGSPMLSEKAWEASHGN